MTAQTLLDRLSARSDDDLLELLRRHDTAEWRPEVFSVAEGILRARGIDPPDVQPAPLAASDDTVFVSPPDGDLTDVASFPTVVAADACRSALTAAGFAVTVLDEFVLQQDPSMGPLLGWVRLAVPSSQAEEARAYLAHAEQSSHGE